VFCILLELLFRFFQLIARKKETYKNPHKQPRPRGLSWYRTTDSLSQLKVNTATSLQNRLDGLRGVPVCIFCIPWGSLGHLLGAFLHQTMPKATRQTPKATYMSATGPHHSERHRGGKTEGNWILLKTHPCICMLQCSIDLRGKGVSNELTISHRNRVLASMELRDGLGRSSRAFFSFLGGLWDPSLGSFLHQMAMSD